MAQDDETTEVEVLETKVSETKPLTVCVETTMKLMGLKRTHIYDLINNGHLSSVKIGKRRLIHMSSINHLLEHGLAPESETEAA